MLKQITQIPIKKNIDPRKLDNKNVQNLQQQENIIIYIIDVK